MPHDHPRRTRGAAAVPGRRHRGAGRSGRGPGERAVPQGRATRPPARCGSPTSRLPRRRSTSRPRPTSRTCPCSPATGSGTPRSEPTRTAGARPPGRSGCSVVPEEVPSGFVVAASIADATSMVTNWGSNGVEYINTDISLTLARLPVGREIGLARCRPGQPGRHRGRDRDRLRPQRTPGHVDDQLDLQRQAHASTSPCTTSATTRAAPAPSRPPAASAQRRHQLLEQVGELAAVVGGQAAQERLARCRAATRRRRRRWSCRWP